LPNVRNQLDASVAFPSRGRSCCAVGNWRRRPCAVWQVAPFGNWRRLAGRAPRPVAPFK
jgi:hypothetical protein